MTSVFDHIILKAELSQSSEYGEMYEKMLETKAGDSYTNPITGDIFSIRNKILLKYDMLSDFQKKMLETIFDKFNEVATKIDPKRLKPFEHYYNDDKELLLFRKTDQGLINIIMDQEECITFSFIPYTNSDKPKKLYFIYSGEDFETLAYNFFSYQ